MNFMRQHWFDVGLVLALLAGGLAFLNRANPLSLLLWASLVSLCLHQFEEYRYPGYFPGMMNSVIFSSQHPDRYPLNSNIALIINVFVGWFVYLLAALFGEKILWLAIATLLVSVGNFFAHTFLFNLKGRTLYNPGMFTAIFLFAPLALYFGYFVIQNNIAAMMDWIIGILLGIGLSYIGIFKLIDWLKDENTKYIFPKRSLLPHK